MINDINLTIDAAVVTMEASLNYENGQAVEKDLHESAEPHNSKRMRCELQNNNNLDKSKYGMLKKYSWYGHYMSSCHHMWFDFYRMLLHSYVYYTCHLLILKDVNGYDSKCIKYIKITIVTNQ